MLRARLLITVATLAFGCGDRTSDSADASPTASAHPAPPASTPAPIDPFTDEGLAALRPPPHTLWPLEHREVLTDFGWRVDPATGVGISMHTGIDLGADRGDLVLSIADGDVRFAGRDPVHGNRVVVDHGDGITSVYADLLDVLVHEGLAVQRGAAVGLVGASGESTTPHLHLQIEVDGVAVDPMLILGQPLYRPEAAVAPVAPQE